METINVLVKANIKNIAVVLKLSTTLYALSIPSMYRMKSYKRVHEWRSGRRSKKKKGLLDG